MHFVIAYKRPSPLVYPPCVGGGDDDVEVLAMISHLRFLLGHHLNTSRCKPSVNTTNEFSSLNLESSSLK